MNHQKIARRFLVGLYLAMSVCGVVAVALPRNEPLAWLTTLLLALIATEWMLFDAKSHRMPVLHVLKMLYFGFWPAGLVIYLIYRSGLWGLLISLIHGIGLLFVLFGSALAAFAIVNPM